MSNILSQSLVDQLWAEYQVNQNTAKIAAKYRISEKTVRRYRRTLNWDERLRKIREQAQVQIDQDSTKRMAENLMLLRGAKKVYASTLIGSAKTLCPHCNKEVIVPIPRIKAKLGDIEKLIRCEEMVLHPRQQASPLPVGSDLGEEGDLEE